MDISQSRTQHRWKFLVVGVILTLGSTLWGSKRFPANAEEIGEFIGAAASGLLWGWIVWLWWARAYKKAAVVTGTLVVLVVCAMLFVHDPRTPAEAFVSGCVKQCRSQAASQIVNPNSPAFGMTDIDVGGYCDCYCKGVVGSLTPEQLARLDHLPSKSDIKADPQFAALLVNSMRACFPSYSRKK